MDLIYVYGGVCWRLKCEREPNVLQALPYLLPDWSFKINVSNRITTTTAAGISEGLYFLRIES